MSLRSFLFSALAAVALAASPVQADPVYLGDTGYYGPIPEYDGTRADLWNTTPIVAVGIAAAALGAAIYLNVPDRHRGNWRNYCHLYNACYKRVHFVRNDWYDRHYAPRYRSRHPSNRPRAAYTPARRAPAHAAPARPAHRSMPARPQHRPDAMPPRPQPRHTGGPARHHHR